MCVKFKGEPVVSRRDTSRLVSVFKVITGWETDDHQVTTIKRQYFSSAVIECFGREVGAARVCATGGPVVVREGFLEEGAFAVCES